MKTKLYIFTILCLLVSCFSCPLKVDAKNYEDPKSNNYSMLEEIVVINEYKAILDEVKIFETKVKTSLNLNDMKKYSELLNEKNEYIQFLYKQKELSVSELREENYTENQMKL